MADYFPQVFICNTLEEAKKVILNEEIGLTTDERWERETPWLIDRIKFGREGMVVDYGCGIGRIARHLGRQVLGVDLSPTMRIMAESYVGRPDFVAVHPPAFDMLTRNGLRAVGAVAVWTLQHAVTPEDDIKMLAACLSKGDDFWLVNRSNRAIPAMHIGRDDAGTIVEQQFMWTEDGVDIFELMRRWFDIVTLDDMPSDLCKAGASISHWHRNAAPAWDIDDAGITVIRASQQPQAAA